MKISYAICVCNESRDLYSLIAFLKKVKDPEDEINVLVDSLHVTPQVRRVLEHFKDDITQNERDFDGDFAKHRNYHIEKCTGDYIFTIDPDEMPQELLIRKLRDIINETQCDIIAIPRVNICPGYTQDWLTKCNFKLNACGWINWPDFQMRIMKNDPNIRWTKELHETISGFKKPISLESIPDIALWHIKSVEKQDNRWDDETREYVVPDGGNLYDTLM